MPARKSDTTKVEIEVVAIQQGEVTISVLGRTPLILNRLSEKAKHELLLPRGRKNAAERAATLKHNPMEEFRASPYMLPDEDAPTLICLPNEVFKGAISSAALDMPGATKAQIGRLVSIVGGRIPVYGEPQLLMSVVRQADINRTPDIRTRCILPEWCAQVTVSYVRPQLRETAILNLLGAAGILSGVGDWRQQKGKGSYGLFELVPANDERVKALMKTWGRKQQQAAMDSPVPYDMDSAELLTWFSEETERRGIDLPELTALELMEATSNGH